MAIVDVGSCNQAGESGRPEPRPPQAAAAPSPPARAGGGRSEQPVRVTIRICDGVLVLNRQTHQAPVPLGHARHRKLTASPGPALLEAIFSDWGWTLRAAFITGEVLCAALGALALAVHSFTAGTGAFGTGAVALVLTAVLRRRSGKSPRTEE